MANSNWNEKDASRTSSSREESSERHGSARGNEDQGDGFDSGNARQGGMSGAGSGGSREGRTDDRDSGLDSSRERVSEGSVRLVADCTSLDYTSSAGLRSLLSAVKLARQHGGDLRLAAIQAHVLRVLDLSGFTSILKSYPDVQSAVGSFAEQA